MYSGVMSLPTLAATGQNDTLLEWLLWLMVFH
jgi:hypothetical protein